MPKKKHPQFHEINVKITKKLAEIHKKISDLDNDDRELSHHEFLKVAKKPEGKKSFIKFAEVLIQKTNEHGKINTCIWYKAGLSALKTVVGKDMDIRFADIDEALLRRLYDYLVSKPVRDTTISNYMRALSSIFNKAIEEGEISKREFPFDLSRLQTKTQKRAISKSAMVNICTIKVEAGSALEFAENS
jgi:hypothetical protein